MRPGPDRRSHLWQGAALRRVVGCTGPLCAILFSALPLSAAPWPCSRVLLDAEARTSVRLSDQQSRAFTPAVAAGPNDSLLLVWNQHDEQGVSELMFRFAENGCLSPAHRVPESLPGSRKPSALWTGHDWVIVYEAQPIPTPLIRRVRVQHGSGASTAPRTLNLPGTVGARPRMALTPRSVAYVWSAANRIESAYEEIEPASDDAPFDRQPVLRFSSGGVSIRHEIATLADGSLHVLAADRPKAGGSSNTARIVIASRPPDGQFGEPVDITSFKRERSDQISVLADAEDPRSLRLAWVQQNRRRPDNFELRTARWTPSGNSGKLTQVKVFPLGREQAHWPHLLEDRLLWQAGFASRGPLYEIELGAEGDGPAAAAAQHRLRAGSVSQPRALQTTDGVVHIVFQRFPEGQVHYATLR